jgi:hypothetical protein
VPLKQPTERQREALLEQGPAIPAVTRALEAKARKGDVNAGRELRKWLQMPENEALRGDLWLEALSDDEREAVLAIIEPALAPWS